MDFRVEIVRVTSDAELPDTTRDVFRVAEEDFAAFMVDLRLGGVLKMAIRRDDAVPWISNLEPPPVPEA